VETEERDQINANCGCRIVPVRQFNPAKIIRCAMHEYTADLLEAALSAKDTLEALSGISDVTGEWVRLGEAISLVQGIRQSAQEQTDEVPTDSESSLSPAVGDPANDVYGDAGLNSIQGVGRYSY